MIEKRRNGLEIVKIILRNYERGDATEKAVFPRRSITSFSPQSPRHHPSITEHSTV
jgi:hypothetical protein